MNKLTEQNLLKKSRFLKYSLLASISVGAVMAMPVEGMAMSKEAFRTELSKKLSLRLSQSNENKDTTNTSQQIETVIVPRPEINTYTPYEIREMLISNQRKDKASNPLKDIPIEDHYKVIARSKSDVGSKRKVRPPTRRKIFVGSEKTEESQNTYAPEPTEQTPQKPEIMITESSPTVSPASNSFVTAPNTPPNTNSKAARRLSFSREPQQIEQANTAIKSEISPKPSGLNKLVSTKPQKKAQVTKIPAASSFLNQQKQLDVLTQQEKVKAARQAVVDKNRAGANKVKRDGAKNKKFINQRDQAQLKQNQQYITTEKTKKQQQAEDKQRAEKEKAQDIVNIREDIATKNQQISSAASTTLNNLQELKSRVAVITDEKQKQEAQKQLSEIQKQGKAIKTIADKATKVKASVEKEKSRTALRAMQDKMNDYSEQLDKIEENLKLLTPVVYSSTGSTYKQPPKAEPTLPLTHGVQRILGEQLDKYGVYLVPKQCQQQDYITVLPDNIGASSGFNLSSTLGSENEIQQNVQAVLDTPVKQTKENKPKEIPTPANMNGLPKNLAVTPPINVGSLYNSPQAQQFREDHKNIIINAINSISSSEVPKESIDPTITKSLPYLDNDQYQEVVLRADRVHDINTRSYLLSKLKQLGESEVRENTAVYDSLYNTASPEELKKAEDLLDRSQGRLNLVDSTIKKGTQLPKSNNTTEQLPVRSAELDKRLDYLDLGSSMFDLSTLTTQDQSRKVENAQEFVEEQYATVLNKNLNDKEQPKRLAQEALDLSVKQSQLKQVQAGTEEIVEPIRKDIKNLKNPITLKQITAKLATEQFLNEEQLEDFLELWRKNNDDPSLTELMNQISKRDERIQKLKEEKKILEDKAIPNSSMNKSEFSSSVDDISSAAQSSKPLILYRSPSVSSLNSLYNGHDLSSRDVVPPVDTLTIETNKGYVDTYIRVLSNKIQKMEELPGSSSRSEELIHIKEAMAYISNRIQDVEELDEKVLLAINARLQEHDEKISSLLLEKYTGEEAEDILAQSLLQEMLVSDGKSESTLPVGNEEQEDTDVTESGIQKAGDKGLLALPVSSNECALALSDGREKECLALGDGSEDEESYDSGFEEEEETIEQLSDSEENTPETAAIDTVIPLKQEAMEEVKKNIETTAPTLNQGHKIIKNISNIISTRLDPAEVMATVIAAGDEEETRIKRGLWVRSMYGINNHGRVENINGYRGTNKGATIGFDVEIDNNIVGIAYSNVHSVFKFKNSKNNDKELINSHVVSIYGQKELPRNFALQALVSASKNFIKDKTTYSYGDTKIRSNVKHRNHSYNAEALLNYSYLLRNKLIITPNIGLRYGKSRDMVYNETGINVQEIALTMKENNILSGIVGTKVKVPLKDVLKFNNLGLTFQGAVEHNFKEKTQRINRVVKIFDTEFKQNYVIPKQPKTSYNLGTGIIGSIKNITISLDYNYYLNKHYRSHQGSVKLKVNL